MLLYVLHLKRCYKSVNSPVPFPTACKVASGPRLSKSSFISSAQKQRSGERDMQGEISVAKYLHASDRNQQTLTKRLLGRRYGGKAVKAPLCIVACHSFVQHA